jgi:glyoxylase-like metal-dependent hydrolase (beta-lactamase superfamily II)/rhodanese-related sulfurtransferase
MYFQQFYLACLAHASYLIGSDGIAAVVDPQRDVGLYLEDAEKHGLKIAYIIETHLHADFVSGHRELAARTGAEIYVGARAGAQFPHRDVRDGDEIAFGRTILRFLETPGHSADSICILVTDLDRTPQPWAALTGDTLFIGEVGRPDLSPDHTAEELAAMLYDSLHTKLMKLPDNVEIYPAHGAGSLCGRNISPERQSTIGKGRALNYALRPMSREDFIRLMVTDLPERPEYFYRDKEINRAGAPAVADLPGLPAFSPEEVANWQSRNAVVLDTRPAAQYGAGHIPGSIHIALCGQYASWAGTLLGLEKPVVIVADDAGRADEARLRLARVGLDKAVGYLHDGVHAWQQAGLPLEDVPQISVLQLHEQLREQPDAVQIIDVRRSGEWAAGHIGHANLKPLHKLRTLLDDLNSQQPLAVYCRSGYRSSIGTSLLQGAGFKQVMNVVGGFDAWEAHKLPTVI